MMTEYRNGNLSVYSCIYKVYRKAILAFIASIAKVMCKQLHDIASPATGNQSYYADVLISLIITAFGLIIALVVETIASLWA